MTWSAEIFYFTYPLIQLLTATHRRGTVSGKRAYKISKGHNSQTTGLEARGVGPTTERQRACWPTLYTCFFQLPLEGQHWPCRPRIRPSNSTQPESTQISFLTRPRKWKVFPLAACWRRWNGNNYPQTLCFNLWKMLCILRGFLTSAYTYCIWLGINCGLIGSGKVGEKSAIWRQTNLR